MCSGSTPQTPAVADPAAEREQAAEDATAAANAQKVADKRRKRASDNLLADLGQGLDTLGGSPSSGAGGSVLSGGSGVAGAAARGNATGAAIGGNIGGAVGSTIGGFFDQPAAPTTNLRTSA